MLSVLIVVAHPDDEVLGCGGTAARLAAQNIPVRSCILSGEVKARQYRPEDQALIDDLKEAQRRLGMQEPIIGQFPNIKFNTEPHLHLVQFIEAAIHETKATLLFTHHPHDLNNDHLHTSQACQAAARLFQRGNQAPRLRGLYYMEIQSSTDWAFAGPQQPFIPDTYVELGEEFLDCKIDALRAYRGVMRPYPHPRSEEVIRGLAACRGGEAGMHFAEAFQTAFFAPDITRWE